MTMPANDSTSSGMRGIYQRRMLEVRGAFEAGGASGAVTIAARAAALDELVRGLWAQAIERDSRMGNGISLVAVGGYGRRELFPYSDVDLLFLLDGKLAEKDVKDAIRRVNQEMWDCGIRVAPATRRLSECEKFDAENAEFALSLMDHRWVTGDAMLYDKLAEQIVPKLLQREHKAITVRLLELTRARHAKYGDTLFHLEPNIKDCPGGLRDVHVCGWMTRLRAAAASTQKKGGAGGEGEGGGGPAADGNEFRKAVDFLRLVRCFLHYRHERDDNTLDWQAQDAAAETAVGMTGRKPKKADAAYWMRLYFRHARSVERRVTQMLEDAPATSSRLPGLKRDRKVEVEQHGFRLERGRVVLETSTEFGHDPAEDPDVVLQVFGAMARTGVTLGGDAEERLSQGLPLLSAHLEEGPALWHHLQGILKGAYSGDALRSMHALGVLELLIPEFHGIDALVIRDAYHRYTVDEHTFVLIDTLHGLESAQSGGMAEWATRLGGVLRELPHPELLYLAALLHDTGKGRSTGDHTRESARMAESVLERLELDTYESGLVVSLIANHLEMSAALRRDIFDEETVRAFAGKMQTPEALRMLTLFTYADINAVHPDALTPWKAENLWQLFIATANYLDRSVDEERLGAQEESELVHRVVALLPGQKAAVLEYLAGFPERYVLTRTPEQVRTHFKMAMGFANDPVQLDFRYAPAVSELTLVTRDRPQLFATVAGALAAWGMNIVTADAFSNRQWVVVDTFRFTDSFRTLEMNASEHEAFVKSVHDVMTGAVSVEKLLSGRRRGRRKAPLVEVETRVEFDDEASSHSTLLEVVTQDTTGLLRALSLTLAAHGCSIEVALVDTEGETAIDVFYLTRNGGKLDKNEQRVLRRALIQAIEENAQ
ncbi:[protein-PII] uridylyltransferase [Tunturibacter empetritectus]|uniref:Bifunctional uridylyltransferase/uridylyl-removing enzyme n=1 Tax=Tunturiibacter lichenicola TaxID=2051959 RepID=A0A7W8N382_9BACT|nr:[protein-PII] uridylyltransferase [Edaphobacter lichenicola]MBB5343188.1 [protein-PII] uridylyltransferase [Edaphobacter lichenicola]